jgi:hypothetical protein
MPELFCIHAAKDEANYYGLARHKLALTHWAQTFNLAAKLQTKPC